MPDIPVEGRLCEDGAETGVLQPQAKECQKLPDWKRHGRLPLGAFGKSMAQLIPGFWTSGLGSCEKTNSCCFKSPVCGNLLQQPYEMPKGCLYAYICYTVVTQERDSHPHVAPGDVSTSPS